MNYNKKIAAYIKVPQATLEDIGPNTAWRQELEASLIRQMNDQYATANKKGVRSFWVGPPQVRLGYANDNFIKNDATVLMQRYVKSYRVPRILNKK